MIEKFEKEFFNPDLLFLEFERELLLKAKDKSNLVPIKIWRKRKDGSIHLQTYYVNPFKLKYFDFGLENLLTSPEGQKEEKKLKGKKGKFETTELAIKYSNEFKIISELHEKKPELFKREKHFASFFSGGATLLNLSNFNKRFILKNIDDQFFLLYIDDRKFKSAFLNFIEQSGLEEHFSEILNDDEKLFEFFKRNSIYPTAEERVLNEVFFSSFINKKFPTLNLVPFSFVGKRKKAQSDEGGKETTQILLYQQYINDNSETLEIWTDKLAKIFDEKRFVIPLYHNPYALSDVEYLLKAERFKSVLNETLPDLIRISDILFSKEEHIKVMLYDVFFGIPDRHLGNIKIDLKKGKLYFIDNELINISCATHFGIATPAFVKFLNDLRGIYLMLNKVIEELIRRGEKKSIENLDIVENLLSTFENFRRNIFMHFGKISHIVEKVIKELIENYDDIKKEVLSAFEEFHKENLSYFKSEDVLEVRKKFVEKRFEVFREVFLKKQKPLLAILNEENWVDFKTLLSLNLHFSVSNYKIDKEKLKNKNFVLEQLNL